MKFMKVGFVLVCAVIFAVACNQAANTPNIAKNVNAGNSSTNSTKPADPTLAPAVPPVGEVADGKKIYSTNCMICHQESGKGGKVTVEGKQLEPDDLTNAKMKAKSDEKLTGYIVDGAPDDGMPAFKGKLTDDQIKAVVQHLRSLQGS